MDEIDLELTGTELYDVAAQGKSNKPLTHFWVDAVSRGDAETVAKWIDLGRVDVNVADRDGDVPLLVAAKKNQIAMLELLLQYGAWSASYPEDEAASLAQIKLRLDLAGAFFLGAYDSLNDQLVGFVNGTLAPRRDLEDETMSLHDPNGHFLCIHSVVIDTAYRRRGLASAMLKHYVDGILANQVV
ncbi:hypothetical protein DYB37_009451 [Aphanomyces astaci]|uniref:N-acetyltransferase domain-containing protein n=1 Tax=Aphanomyces astaci TaxID=112090 RepID=A0A397CZB7_APHAT|nr:hypothetical protein DYB36_004507 [Aphanomyces astaci]RHY36469.1 hypothetical protein DYB38_009499 [Aphanomyces astaci]RHY55810.1 hypothetical protein DYB30_009274 [Aphanomyces astaci]RHY60242.1 hypothetical protein DYB34_001473 [Aphanomyces astaci]RHY89714.1 hypothetical protein DYB35_006686 [Aphanomyces astaci]